MIHTGRERNEKENKLFKLNKYCLKYKCENVCVCVFVGIIKTCKENSRLKVVLFRELRVGAGLGKWTQTKVSC